jgi:hypothetical protein
MQLYYTGTERGSGIVGLYPRLPRLPPLLSELSTDRLAKGLFGIDLALQPRAP